MPKFRVIPTVLTNGVAQVKGSNFNNWRTVGSVAQAIRVHGQRDVDEIVLLDVAATKEGRLISPRLIHSVSSSLRVPLSVGGGVKSAEHVAELLAAGADKVVIGSSAIEVPGLVSELAATFGTQAIVCAIDVIDDASDRIAVRSGLMPLDYSPQSYAKTLEDAGAGEILLQTISRDGLLSGMNIELLREISGELSIPVILGSGASGVEDFYIAYSAGASAVSAGALFQFTEITPEVVKQFLKEQGVPVRN